MIISRTPFRISFFGGGTDYPDWFRYNGGEVLSTTIDKYCYLTCRYLPPFFEHRSRIVWSEIERVTETSDIKHPAVREILKFLDINDGVEIHHDGDLPARAGLGSSSSFAVGLLNALAYLKGLAPSKRQLALDAIFIEQVQLKENVGSQDQVNAAFGGLNRITFGGADDFAVTPVSLKASRLHELQSHLLLIFTGFSRTASDVAAEQIAAIGDKYSELRAMQDMVLEAITILQSQTDICDFGKLLHDSWILKRSLTKRISNPKIDDIYNEAIRTGAIGGKLLGAGGGGVMLIFVKPDHLAAVREALKDFLYVPFVFENEGSQIIFTDDSMKLTKLVSE